MVISPRAYGRNAIARAASFCNRVLGFVNAPALMQRALPGVLGHDGGQVDVAVYASNCQRMASALRALDFQLAQPKAGFFLFPRLPQGQIDAAARGDVSSDVALTEALREARCVVVPGTAFGEPDHLRLSLCVDPAAVTGAIEAFERVCRT